MPVSRGPRPARLSAALGCGLALGATAPAAAQDIAARLERASPALDSLVRATMRDTHIPGAALVIVSDGAVRVTRGYGLADTATRTPVDPDRTIFRIGSVSKTLTALALLRLVDEGRIGLDDVVAPQLPATLPALDRFSQPVRLRHLLSHSAGFDQVGLRRQMDDPAARPTLEQFLARELVQSRPPGVVGVYDTYGMTLAGYLIERLTGTAYAEFMRHRVFEPLGMRHTYVETPSPLRDRLAAGYGLEDGVLTEQPYEWYVTLPASSIDATAADMGRLLQALLGGGANEHGRLLSAALAARVLAETQLRYAPDMAAFSWGFWEESRDGYRAIRHGGIMRGYSSELYLVPEAGLGMFVVYNRDPETGPDPLLRERLVDALYAHVLPPRGAVASVPREPLAVPTEQFAGAYGNTVGCFTCDEGEGWGINTLRFTSPTMGVLALGPRRWLAVDSTGVRSTEVDGSLLRFVRDRDGAVRYLVRGPTSFARLDARLLNELLGPGWERRAPAPIVALTYRANADWQNAAAAYGSLARRHPANGAYPFYQGFSLLHLRRFAEAHAAFQTAVERKKWIPWSRYYIASAHAGRGDAPAAFAALRDAIAGGFNDPNLPMTEPWWAALRARGEFREILAAIDR